jgi:hypothetical protein
MQRKVTVSHSLVTTYLHCEDSMPFTVQLDLDANTEARIAAMADQWQEFPNWKPYDKSVTYIIYRSVCINNCR